MRCTGIGSLGFTSEMGTKQADGQTVYGKIIGSRTPISPTGAVAKAIAKTNTTVAPKTTPTTTAAPKPVTVFVPPKPHLTADKLQPKPAAPAPVTAAKPVTTAKPSVASGVVTVTKQGTPNAGEGTALAKPAAPAGGSLWPIIALAAYFIS